MKKKTICPLVCCILGLGLSACGGPKNMGSEPFPNDMIATDDNILPTDYLAVNYSAVGDVESCVLDYYVSINKEAGLYFVDYDIFVNGRNFRFPGQIKLSGHNRLAVGRMKGNTGIYDQAACASYDIEWRNMKCTSQDRQDMPCPEVKFYGPHGLKSIRAIAQ